MFPDDQYHMQVLVPATPGTPAGSTGRARPPPPKWPHCDRDATRRNLDQQLVAVTVAGESASGEGVTATHSEPAVSGALCATDLAGEEGGGKPAVGLCAPRHGNPTPGEGKLAVELCAPRLDDPNLVGSLVPRESDSTVVMCAPGHPSASASSGNDDHNLTDRLNLPPHYTMGEHMVVLSFIWQQWSQQHSGHPQSVATSTLWGYTPHT